MVNLLHANLLFLFYAFRFYRGFFIKKNLFLSNEWKERLEPATNLLPI